MNAITNIARRHFIISSATIGSGLAIGFDLSLAPAFANTASDAPEIGAWVVIQPDEKVIVRVVRSEMGQGTITGLAQMVAEELQCDWKNVSYSYPTPAESIKRKAVWGSFSTGGSRGIRTSEQYVRKGGAAARMMLVQAAAEQWGVSPSECEAQKGVITHKPTGRKTTFGKVAVAASKLPVPTQISLKDPKDWNIIGKPLDRIDNLSSKTNGKQVYAIDLKLPGMLTATIKESPVFGGKVKSFDAAKISNLQGVRKVLQVGDTAVAVIADTFWQAKVALDQLPIEWDEGPNASIQQADILKKIEEGLTASQAFVGNSNGDYSKVLAESAQKVEGTYFYPFLNHAPLEPMNATAKWTPEQCTAWVPTQDGEASMAAVVAASGLSADKCDVIKINLGGGFGRRGAFQDYTTHARYASKIDLDTRRRYDSGTLPSDYDV